jgi:two-component system, response regulator PdtaR
MHALIIEDEWFIVDAVEDALRQIGFSSFADANSVAEAVAAAHVTCPDLIVANHQLIDGTGTDAVLAICSDQEIPVVFVTANGSEVRSTLPHAIVVSKPFVSLSLHSAVEQAQECPFVCPCRN